MRRFLVAFLITVMAFVAVPVAAQRADAAKVNCTVLIFKPSWFWARGSWTPQSLRGTDGIEDWYWQCHGRFRPKKKAPDAPTPKHGWGVNIKLNLNNCSYTADENLKDPAWWKHAVLYIS